MRTERMTLLETAACVAVWVSAVAFWCGLMWVVMKVVT